MEATVKEFTTKGYYAPADLTKPDEIKRAVVEAIDKMGGIDILINNGAVSNEDLDSPTNVNVLKHLLDIHVVGCMALIDACKDELLKNKGSVVNVSSALSEVIADQFIPYNIAKAAEDALTRNMAMNWARFGVRVNSINPSVVDTDAQEAIAKKMGVTKEQVLQMNSRMHPLGTYSQAYEQANAILFLSSKTSSSTVTGNTLFTDGGVRLTNWFNAALQPPPATASQ
eukprot:TRINITY_DN5107_c0_g2_i6.p1 TRINITY_DN5107_c0_g2~~TRINITY_DN5107_c0_g2_i6.p1  ORF type:complete len:227 (+),score=47.88 TRINITY_DN5107_c0_g2_i6:280-960(+)